MMRRDVFAAAEQSRLFADWNGYILSATQELRYELRTLRGRSRALARNNPHARKFINALTTNVVGPKGIRLQATNVTRSGTRDRATNVLVESAWRAWGQRGTCTVDKRLSWKDVERLVLATIAIDGEVLAAEVPYADNAHGYALQLIDPDLLDEAYNVAAGPAGNPIRMGIEVDRVTTAPVAYWLWTRHPFDAQSGMTLERQRFPAEQMHHLFVPWRIGQLRGIPWMAPAMKALQHLGGYVDAEVIAARTASAKMGFITQDAAEGASGADPDDIEDESGEKESPFLEAAPGMLEHLGPGESFLGWDPTHPTSQVMPFMNAMLHFCAAGVNTAAVTLTGDLSQVNYSSIREGKLTERDAWEVLQDWLASVLHEPVFSSWLPLARAAGALAVRGPVAGFSLHRWQPRGWPWVDPLKDVQASERELALRLTTRTRLAAERGDDFEEILTEWKDEQALAASLGVALPDPQPIPVAAGTYDGTDNGSSPNAPGGSEDAPAAASAGGGRARLVALRHAR